jgi:MFS family permease
MALPLTSDTVPQPSEDAAAIRYLLWARGLRDFGDGFVAVLLPAYLTMLGFSPFQIGLIATAALLGSALLTLGIGLIGVRFDHRLLLLAAALSMAATGVAFSAFDHALVLFVIAFIGTVNPSGVSVSVFAPLEQSILASRVAASERTRTFARYSLVGALAGAAGALAAATPDLVAPLGIGQLTAIKLMLGLYAVLGLISGHIYTRIPARPLSPTSAPKAALGPSRRIVYKMAVLFSLDSFGGGFLVQSLLALWLFERFGLWLTAAGVFFFWTGVFSAFSFPVAAWLAKRIGLINTMVFTHAPSSLCLIAAAFVPSLPVVLALLLLRSALSQMDVPTRTSYVMAVVTEPERPAAASFTAVPRSITAAISPTIAGALFSASLQSLPLVLCGTCKIIYDILLLLQFRHTKPPEEQ